MIHLKSEKKQPEKTLSISRKLTISLIGTVFAVSSLFVALNSYHTSRIMKKDLAAKADEYMEILAAATQSGLWELNTDSIRHIGEYFSKNELIVSIKIMGMEGDVFFGMDKEVPGPYIHRDRRFFFKGHYIGRASLSMTEVHYRRLNRKLIGSSLITIFIVLVTLVGSTGYFLRIFLGRPLEKMEEMIHLYRNGVYRDTGVRMPWREFRPFVSVVEEMGREIDKRMGQLEKADAELRNYAENLEKMVAEKTGELRSANQELSSVVERLEETREQLTISAHQSGMAEMAVSVLHNIGNAVNSVNVRAHRMGESARSCPVVSLEKILSRMKTMVFSSDPETEAMKEKLLALFAATIEILEKRNREFLSDLDFVQKGVEHIMEIIAIQQRYAGLEGFETLENINELVTDSIEMMMDGISKRRIELYFDLGEVPLILMDKNKMVQILVNIIKNAVESIDALSYEAPGRIHIRTRLKEGFIVLALTDNGVGISSEEQAKVFRFNYSTKNRGTGFGLHDAANYIIARSGNIDLKSEGPGKGACVEIRLPVKKEEPTRKDRKEKQDEQTNHRDR